jgi:hypothetical protein
MENPYTIGHYYFVPCVKTTYQQLVGKGEWVPVIGSLHEDAAFINFPAPHWHTDWRFASQKQYRRRVNNLFGVPVQQTTNDQQVLLVTEGPVLRRVLCKRAMPRFPREIAHWLPALEAAYAGHTLKNMVCPHRGLPLDGCERHGDIVVCPGHGLRWNIKTGKLS